jgi:hypothetical protein
MNYNTAYYPALLMFSSSSASGTGFVIFGSIYMYNVGEYYIVVIDIEV